MKVLMISGDKNLLVPGTGAHERLALQRSAVAQLDVFVWPQVHSLRQIFSAARRTRYDIVTAQDPFWRGHLARHLTQLFGGRLNIQVHADLSAISRLRRFFARYHLRSADSIRVVSEKLKKQVESFEVRGKITVLPIFIDIEPYKTLTHTPESNSILWIGRFEAEKDPLAAIAILKAVRAEIPDAKLTMLGEGSMKEQLQQIARGLPIEFPGWQNPLSYLQKAAVVLSTSPEESYGASIIEALAAGVPVVAPDVGVAKEAGAIVVPKAELAKTIINALRTHARGELKLTLPTAEEWARRWKESL